MIAGLANVDLPADIHVTRIESSSIMAIAKHLIDIQNADLVVLCDSDGSLFDLPKKIDDIEPLLSLLRLGRNLHAQFAAVVLVQELHLLQEGTVFLSNREAQATRKRRIDEALSKLTDIQNSSEFMCGFNQLVSAGTRLLIDCFAGGRGPSPQEIIIITPGRSHTPFGRQLLQSVLAPPAKPGPAGGVTKPAMDVHTACQNGRHLAIVDALRLTNTAAPRTFRFPPLDVPAFCTTMTGRVSLAPIHNRTGHVVGLSGNACNLTFMIAEAQSSALPEAQRHNALTTEVFAKLRSELPEDPASRAKRFRLVLTGEPVLSSNKKLGWKIWIDGTLRRISMGQMEKLLAFVVAKLAPATDHGGVTYQGAFSDRQIKDFIPAWVNDKKVAQEVRAAIPKDWLEVRLAPDRYELSLSAGEVDAHPMLESRSAASRKHYSPAINGLVDVLRDNRR